MWPDVVKQLNWTSDTSDPTQTASLATQLAQTYQRLLYPFEEVWHKSLMKQHQQLLESRRKSGVAIPTTAAMAGMTPTQLLGFGFNASQVEFMRSQASTGASAGPTMATAPIVTASPQTQATALAPGQLPGPTGTSLRPNTFEPSLEQISEARAIVSQLRSKMDGTRRAPFLSRVELAPSADTEDSRQQRSSSSSPCRRRKRRALRRSRTSSVRSSRRWTRSSRSSSP